uniref:Uncharacterized protein n=1 Tax=Anguilla anguilla TaxID=7936 RepID=A0A0E9XCR6_ANGAN
MSLWSYRQELCIFLC